MTALSFKQNLIWNSLGNVVYLGCQWLFSYLTTRLLGYEPAGVLSLAMTISGSLSNVALYAMRNYQTSDVNGSFSDGVYIRSRLLTSGLAFIVCCLFLEINGYAYETGICIIAYMLFKIIEALSDVYQGIMQRNMRMDYIGKSFIAKGLSSLATFSLALVISRSLFIGICALCLTNLLIVLLYDRKRALMLPDYGNRSIATDNREVLRLLWTCLPLAVYGLLFNTMGQAPRYFLEAKLGTEMLGYYASVAMPVTIVQVSASFIFSPLTTPLAERLEHNDVRGFTRLIVQVVIAVTVLAAIALAMFGLFGNALLTLLFGSSIAPYTYLIIPLVISGILLAFSWFLSTVVTVLRLLKPLLLASALSFLIVVLGSNYFIDVFGMNGASFILIVSMSFFIVLNVAIIGQYLLRLRGGDLK